MCTISSVEWLTFLCSQLTKLVEGCGSLSTTNQGQSVWRNSQSVGIFDVTGHSIYFSFQEWYSVIFGTDYSLQWKWFNRVSELTDWLTEKDDFESESNGTAEKKQRNGWQTRDWTACFLWPCMLCAWPRMQWPSSLAVPGAGGRRLYMQGKLQETTTLGSRCWDTFPNRPQNYTINVISSCSTTQNRVVRPFIKHSFNLQTPPPHSSCSVMTVDSGTLWPPSNPPSVHVDNEGYVSSSKRNLKINIVSGFLNVSQDQWSRFSW